MARWEYQKIALYNEYDLDNFNTYGQEGWELVQIIPTPLSSTGVGLAIFKRPDPQFVEELQGAAQNYSFIQNP